MERALLKLTRYYDKSSIVCNIATILDPRKNLAFLKCLKWEQEWIDSILQSLKDALVVYENSIQILEPIRQTGVPSTSNSLLSSLMNEFDTNDEENTALGVSDIDRYIALARVGNDVHPLDWWKVNESTFPILARLAKD